MKHKIANCIYPKEIYQRIRIKHISLRLAHLAVTLKKPGMSKDLLWKGHVQSHQKDRPVKRMEADNILTDQMKIRRPEPIESLGALTITIIADTGNIVGQSIQPHINNMLGIKGYRNSP